MTSKLELVRKFRALALWMTFIFGILLKSTESFCAEGELNTVAAIRALSVEQSKENISVQLRGVVTFFDESLYSRFIQDETAGIYLKFPLNVAPPMLAPGQLVEV